MEDDEAATVRLRGTTTTPYGEALPTEGLSPTTAASLTDTANFWEGVGDTDGDTFRDDALVVRGGLNRPETLEANLQSGGISANSYPGMSVEQLSKGIPNNQIGVATVGDIRTIGGDVVSSPNEVNPFHATIIPGPGGTQELSGVFDIWPNPWRLPR